MASSQPSLPSNRAFVVQFRGQPAGSRCAMTVESSIWSPARWHASTRMPWHAALPYTFEAGLDSNLFVTLPQGIRVHVACHGVCLAVIILVRCRQMLMYKACKVHSHYVPQEVQWRQSIIGHTAVCGTSAYHRRSTRIFAPNAEGMMQRHIS